MDFEARLITGQAAVGLTTGSGGSPQGFPFLYNRIKDLGSSRNLSNTLVQFPQFAGQSGLPLIMPMPRIFEGKTSVQIELQNNSAAQTIAQTDVAISGRKIFEFNE